MSISNSLNIVPIEYSLQTYHRSNQDTTLLHRPVVNEGDWVQAGDLISDSGSSIGGEFSIGQNLLIAYLPWEGYNYEDAILISERLVYDDLYTSIHIERYDISTEKTPYGNEIITKDILLLKDTTELEHLDENGVAKLGSWLKEGDILVGKITPTEPKKEVARYIQLYNDILGKKMDYSFRDTSLRVPRGLEAKVIRVQLFPETKTRRTKRLEGNKKSLFKGKKVKSFKKRIEPSYLQNYYKGLQIRQNLFAKKASGGFKNASNFLAKEALYQKKKPISFFLDKFFRLNLVQIRPEKTNYMTSFFQFIKTGFPRRMKFNKNLLIQKPIQILLSSRLTKLSKEPRFPAVKKESTSFSSQTPVSGVNIRPLRSYRATEKKKSQKKKTVKLLGSLKYVYLREKTETQNRPSLAKRIPNLQDSSKFFKFRAISLNSVNRVSGGHATEKRKRYNLVLSLLFSSKAFLARKENRKRRDWSYLLFRSVFSLKYRYLREPRRLTVLAKRPRVTEGYPRQKISKKTVLSFPSLFVSKADKHFSPKSLQPENERAQNLTNVKQRTAVEQKKQKQLKAKNTAYLTRKSKNLLFLSESLKKNKTRVSSSKVSLNKRKPMSITSVHVYLAEKRKVQVGDKMAGRHGNKGIISQILPRQDMPYLPDGSPIDLALNPLGVPSRMNVGQIYECLLGLAGKNLGEQYRIKPFDESFGSEASRSFVFSKLYEARRKTGQSWLFQPVNPGKLKLFDGRTGNGYDQPITTGYSYMIKLVHLVDEKIHSRSSGPYSLITQQPLKGRSKHGGQRLGEMEVWAIEAYGAAFILLELLTIKSDDVTGRLTIWDYILYKKPLYIGTPASFKVLICELQALCLDIGIYKADSANNLKQINVSTMG
jgi:DNA-directed RNA polymerase subunit beta